MFGLNKKNKAPPDVGEEDREEVSEDSSEEGNTKELPDVPAQKSNSNAPVYSRAMQSGGVEGSQLNIKIEQLNAKVDSMSNWMKQVYERFSYISESIGEIRSMNLSNEKEVAKAIKDSSQASELVKEVQPDALRMDYKKAEGKLKILEEKIESNKQFVESVLEQFKDLERRADVFIGTDEVLKLNEDTKKELIEIQKLSGRSRLDADKSEQIFMELKKTLSEMQKMNSEFVNFNNSSTQIKKEIEKIKLDHSKVIGDEEFAELKNILDKKFIIMNNHFGAIEGIKETNERLTDLIEKILRMTKSNKENIDSLAFSIGKDNIKRVSDYEDQLSGVLKLVDTLAGQISEIKKQVGIKSKILINIPHEPLAKKNKVNLQHINVPRKIVKKLIPKQEFNHPIIKNVIPEKKTLIKKVPLLIKKSPEVAKKPVQLVKKVPEKIIEEYPEDREIRILKERIDNLSSQI